MVNKKLKPFQTCRTSPWRGLWSVAIAGPPEHGFVNVSQNLYYRIYRTLIEDSYYLIQ